MKNFDRFVQIAMATMPKIQTNKKHVSLLVRKNNVLAIGVNQYKSHPLCALYGYVMQEIHSELDAILKATRQDGKVPRRTTLINMRLSTRSTLRRPVLRMAKPCDCCMKLIMASDIWRCYYTDYNGTFQRL
jgi:deoxycytidylate deaminase